jgi:hypothetical protein
LKSFGLDVGPGDADAHGNDCQEQDHRRQSEEELKPE